MEQVVLDAYVWQRQTAVDLGTRYGKSERWIREQINRVPAPMPCRTPHTTPIAADMTFWGRGYGVCVFRSPTQKQNLWWKESTTETPAIYAEGLQELQRQGFTVTGAVIDGKRGVARVFETQSIPVQYCQFHQIKTVTTYLTRKPKTVAGQELRALTLTLPYTTEALFREALISWHERHDAFLRERTIASHRRRGWEYTHRRIRAAYRSLATNLSQLFTYQRYPELHLPNTTNCLDGMFSQVKNRLAVHRGLRRDRRYKIISTILCGKAKTASRFFH